MPLTRREYELLAYLARRAGRVVEYAELLMAVWGCARPGSDREAVKSTARRLRRKLGDPAAAYLVCVRGVGYMLRKPEPHDDE